MQPSHDLIGLSFEILQYLSTSDRFDEVWGCSVVSGGTSIFCARRGHAHFIVIGDERFGPYDSIARLTSLHDPRPVFCAARGLQIFTVGADGERGPYDAVDDSSFMAAPGDVQVFCVQRDGKHYVVCGGDELGPYDDVYDMHFECEALIGEADADEIHEMRVENTALVCSIVRDGQVRPIQRGFF